MKEEDPLRECLTLTEYINICKDYLLDCFDGNNRIITHNNMLTTECNIRAALDVLDDIDEAEWVDTSEIDEEDPSK